MSNEQSEREAFERKNAGRNLKTYAGSYVDPHVDGDWHVWQDAWSAALASRQAVTPGERECGNCKHAKVHPGVWPCAGCGQGSGSAYDRWEAVPQPKQAPADPIRVACITLDGTTLTIPAEGLTAFGIGEDDGGPFTLTFKTMTRAEYEALGEFDGF